MPWLWGTIAALSGTRIITAITIISPWTSVTTASTSATWSNSISIKVTLFTFFA